MKNYADAERNAAQQLASRLVEKIHNVDPGCPDRLKEVRKLYRELGKRISLIDPRSICTKKGA